MAAFSAFAGTPTRLSQAAPRPEQVKGRRPQSKGPTHHVTSHSPAFRFLMAISAVLCGISFSGCGFGPSEKERRAQEEQLRILSQLTLGQSPAQVESIFAKERPKMVVLHKSSEDTWRIARPVPAFEVNWDAFIGFENERVVRIVVRFSDHTCARPDEAPEDRIEFEDTYCRDELLKVYDALHLGLTPEDVRRVFRNAAKKTYLKLYDDGPPEEHWVITWPRSWRAKNWELQIDFEDSIAVAIRIRWPEDSATLPRYAPEDKVAGMPGE